MTDIDEKRLAAIHDVISATELPPVHTWHPSRSADIDIRILKNGTWLYRGTEIRREKMVRLFSTVLRVDDGETYLVTPQERLRIEVEDAPFTAISLQRCVASETPMLVFTTNVGEQVIADADHLISVRYNNTQEPRPYIRVRDQLDALLVRPVFYQLADYAIERDGQYVVESGRVEMPLGPVAT